MNDETENADLGNGELENGEAADAGATGETLHHLRPIAGLYEGWFLDYASYVILERAVPHLTDGLKPVQRRILHAMKRLDDGRYNKVANVIGHTMQYHPHGDASIGDALVALGQKDLLVDTQGNWGNVYTGDGAAAPRYIEARLSKFALDTVFNPKTTEWKLSYDGRNKEPVLLPVKFPLLLAQGAEGIAVGLSSKILPHNFNELIDACIAHLQGRPFELLPDFPTGGLADCSRYNDGQQGGRVRSRARIAKLDKKTLVITELPCGKTTSSLIDSILAANEKGKIRIRKIDDNTAGNVEILVHLVPGTSTDLTIDGLYAFTDCEVSVSVNCCVIHDDKPRFLGVGEVLKISVENTVRLLEQELRIRRGELEDDWHRSSLEKIFIEKKIYQRIETCETWESILETIDAGLEPYKKRLRRPVTLDDLAALTEIRIKRISRYDAFRADEHLRAVEAEIERIDHHLGHLVEYAVAYYERIRDKYGKGRERRTELRGFDVIEAAKVVLANEKLYVNRKDGFVGTGLKKDEFVSECSVLDDIIVFLKDGRYLVTKVAEKAFVGPDIVHVGVFQKNDERTIYNAIYRNGKTGPAFVKRFAVTGVTRDKEYDLGQGAPGSQVLYLTANPNGEAETVTVSLRPQPLLRKLHFNLDFSTVAIKGRASRGNLVTKHPVARVALKETGVSTLGGRPIWFDPDVVRLNADGRGRLLGDFSGDDRIAAFTRSGSFTTTNFDLANHYEADVTLVEKYDPEKVYTAVFREGEDGFYYVKRFPAEPTEKLLRFIGDHPDSVLVTVSGDAYPRVKLVFGGRKAGVEEEVELADFIGVKSWKAHGRRLSAAVVEEVLPLEPLPVEESSLDPDPDRGEDGGDLGAGDAGDDLAVAETPDKAETKVSRAPKAPSAHTAPPTPSATAAPSAPSAVETATAAREEQPPAAEEPHPAAHPHQLSLFPLDE